MKKLLSSLLVAGMVVTALPNNILAAEITFTYPTEDEVIITDTFTPSCSNAGAEYYLDDAPVSLIGGAIDITDIPYGEHYLTAKAGIDEGSIRFISAAPGATAELLSKSTFDAYSLSNPHRNGIYPGSQIFGAGDRRVCHIGTNDVDVYPVTTGAGISEFSTLTTKSAISDVNDRGFGVCVRDITALAPSFAFVIGYGTKWSGAFVNATGEHDVVGKKSIETDLYIANKQNVYLKRAGFNGDDECIINENGKIGETDYPIGEWFKLVINFDYDALTYSIKINNSVARTGVLDETAVGDIRSYVKIVDTGNNNNSRIYEFAFEKPTDGNNLVAFDNFLIGEPATSLAYVSNMAYTFNSTSVPRTDWGADLLRANASSIDLTFSSNFDRNQLDKVTLTKDGESVECTKALNGRTLTITPSEILAQGTKYKITIAADATSDGKEFGKETVQYFTTSTLTDSEWFLPEEGFRAECGKTTSMDVSAQVIGATGEVRAEIDGTTVKTWAVSDDCLYAESINLPTDLAVGEHTLTISADSQIKLTRTFTITPEVIKFEIVSPTANGRVNVQDTTFEITSPEGTRQLDLYFDNTLIATSTERGEHDVTYISIPEETMKYGKHVAYVTRTLYDGTTEDSDKVIFTAFLGSETTDYDENFDSGLGKLKSNDGDHGASVTVEDGRIVISEAKHGNGYANPYIYGEVSAKNTNQVVNVAFDFMYQNATDKFDFECKSGSEYYVVVVLNNNTIGSTTTSPNKWYHIDMAYKLASGSYTITLTDDASVTTTYSSTTGKTSINEGSLKVNFYNMGFDGTSSMYIDNYKMVTSISLDDFTDSSIASPVEGTQYEYANADTMVLDAVVAGALDTVTAAIDGTVVCSWPINYERTYQATIDVPTNLAVGSHTLTLSADGVVKLSRDFNVIPEIPSSFLNPPSDTEVEQYTDSTLYVKGHVTHATSKVSLELDGSEVKSWEVVKSKTYDTVIDLPDTLGLGSHTLTFKADGLEEAITTFTVIEQKISIISPATGSNFATDEAIFTVVVPDDTSKVDLYIDGKMVASTTESGTHRMAKISIPAEKIPYGSHKAYAVRTATNGAVAFSSTITFTAIKQSETVDFSEDFENGLVSMSGDDGGNSSSVTVKNGIATITEATHKSSMANPYLRVVISSKGTDSVVTAGFDFKYLNPTDKFDLEGKSNGSWYTVIVLDSNTVGGSIATTPGVWYHVDVVYNLAKGNYTINLYDIDGNALGSVTKATGNTKLDATNFKINYYNMGDGMSSMYVDNFTFTDSIAYPYNTGSGYVTNGKAVEASSIPADAEMVCAFLNGSIDTAATNTSKVSLYANGKEVALSAAGFNSNNYVWVKPASKLPEGAELKLVVKIGAKFADGSLFDRNMVQTMTTKASVMADATIITSTGEEITSSSTIKLGSGVCAKITSNELGDDLVAIIAAYDGDKLVGLSYSDEVTDDNGLKTAISNSVTVDRQGLTFKAVAVNDINERIPLTSSVSVTPSIDSNNYSGIVFLNTEFDTLNDIALANTGDNTVEITERSADNNCIHIVRSGNLDNIYFDTKINSNFLDKLVSLDSYILTMDIKIDANNGTLDIFDLKSMDDKWFTMCRIDESGNLSVHGSSAGTLTYGPWHKLAFIFDNTTSKIDCYVDSVLTKSGIDFDPSFAIKLFRNGLELQNGNNEDIYFDNMCFYEGTDIRRVITGVTLDLGNVMETPVSATRYLSTGDVVVAPRVGSICINKTKEYDTDDLYYTDDNIGMISTTLAEKAFGATLTVSGNIATTSGQSLVVTSKGGKNFVSIADLGKALAKNVYEDPRGIIYVTDNEFTYRDSNGVQNLNDVVDIIERYMIFERPSGDEIISSLQSNIGTAHPRVLATEKQFDAIKTKVSSNSLCAYFKTTDITKADKYIGATLPAYEVSYADSANILTIAREVRDKARTLAVAYKLTGDTKYADEAYRVAANAAAYPDWCDTTHFLSTAEMAYGIAIIYDTFYDHLTSEQRNVLTDAVIEKALKPGIKAYQGIHSNGYWVNGNDNWNAICAGGLMATCVAMYDNADVTPYAKQLLPLTLQTFEYVMQLLYPDGAWYESVSYLAYAMQYTCAGLSALMNSNGNNDYDMFKAPGVDKIGNYYVGGMGLVEGTFNYHDGDALRQGEPSFLWYANVIGDNDFAGAYMNIASYFGYYYPEAYLLYYDPAKTNVDFTYPKDVFLRETNIGSMRNGWTQSDMWAAVHAGENGIDHDHLDLGEFIIEADNVRWINDWGKDNYSLPGYFQTAGYDIYRKRPEANNCVMINPRESYQGQSIKCATSLDKFVSNDGEGFMIFDLTNAYSADATSYKRGFMLADNRTSFTVRDEIEMTGENEVYWFANINSGITATVDGNKVTLEKGTHSMTVEFNVNVDDYEISIVPCTPLPTSPTVDGQADDSSRNKIQLRAKGIGNIDITAQFVPGTTTTTTTPAASVKALAEWK